jgi:hypothetical protein
MIDRRGFVGALVGALVTRQGRVPGIDARPTALYAQPDGRTNLVRITVAGLDAPAARARLTDRRGALVGTAGLLPAIDGLVLRGELWVPLSSPAEFQIDVEVGRDRVARQRVRLTPPKRWTLYWVPFAHLDVGGADPQERALETQRRNLDTALARRGGTAQERPLPENALAILSYLDNRPPESGDALLQALREGRIGMPALYANLLTGLLDHETYARVVWPAGLLARERGLAYSAALACDVPGHPLTWPSVLAASGVRFLASGVGWERAAPLVPPGEARAAGLPGRGMLYPQLYYWEGPDGGRVLHWRGAGWGDAERLGFGAGADEMAQRVSAWLLDHPVLTSADYPYDVALLLGTGTTPNAPWDPGVAASVDEFARRFAFPRIVAGRTEDFFRDVERRYTGKIPARRGDTGLYREDGAGQAARELAAFRAAQLAARAADALALWDERLDGPDPGGVERSRRRAAERRDAWRDLLLFAEHTWGPPDSGSQPDSRQAVAHWSYKRSLLEGAAAAVGAQIDWALTRIGRATGPGPGRLVFNASGWPRSDVVRIPRGAGETLSFGGVDLPAVDEPDGSALAVVPAVPALGYLALGRVPRDARPPLDEGEALDARAGGLAVRLDPATGAIASLVGPDGVERVRPGVWSGLNQLLYVRGGERSALWTAADRAGLAQAPVLDVAQASAGSIRRERLAGIGVRLRATRHLAGLETLESTVTLYDDLPWVDVENHFTKAETLDKEAVYAAFPFALERPTVQLEVPLGRMTVERDQQPGSCRDWFCHAHWVWLHDATGGVVWSGPDTPLVTFNDIVRGAWRGALEPDGTLFAWVLHNYWPSNFPPRQGGAFRHRFRLSLHGGDPAEPVRRGWAACDPLWVSGPYESGTPGPLLEKDRALFFSDPGIMLVAAKPADDGEGAALRLLDVTGAARPVSLWPAAYRYVQARRTNLVEMNEEPISVAADGRATVNVPAWGIASLRLFTPREGSG